MHEFKESRHGRPKATPIIALVCMMISAAIATFAMQGLGYPTVLLVSLLAGRSGPFDNATVAPTQLDLRTGTVLVTGIQIAWSDAPEPGSRAKVGGRRDRSIPC